MTTDMHQAIQKILTTTYTGTTRLMLLKSQVTELLAHYFAILSEAPAEPNDIDVQKILTAKEILMQRIETPPSIAELAKLTGVNQQKLKTEFKAFYGAPIYQYLHHARLNKAFDLLRKDTSNIQQVANAVGYESLSSFSNAFTKKFGMRPSAVRQ